MVGVLLFRTVSIATTEMDPRRIAWFVPMR
jgi:hypothetical protein